jgi:hypothetical protein
MGGVLKMRFNWQRFLFLSLLFNCLLVLCGCGWIAEANSIIAVLGPMAAEIISLIGAFDPALLPADAAAIIASAITQASNALNNVVEPILQEYQNSPAAQQPGILDKLQEALQAIKDNLSGVLSSLHISNAAVVQKITDVLTEFIDEIVSLEQLIPVIKAGDTEMSAAALADFHGKVQHVKAKALKKRYNAAVLRPTGDAKVDAIAAKHTLAA